MNFQENCTTPEMNAEKILLKSVKPPYPQPNPWSYCLFCESASHSSHDCCKFHDTNLFWKKILEDRRCKNCLRLYHHSNRCFDRNLCYVKGCRRLEKHSSVLCKLRFMKINSQKDYFYHEFQENSSKYRMSPPLLSKYQPFNPNNNINNVWQFHKSKRRHRRKCYNKYENRNFQTHRNHVRVSECPREANVYVQECQTEVCSVGVQKCEAVVSSVSVQQSQTKIPFVTTADATTQTLECEESNEEHMTNKYSQGSQTQISASSVFVQTEVHIPTAMVMDPCPADFSDPYPESDVPVDLKSPKVSNENHEANVPHYENTTVYDKSFVSRSSSIPIFLRSALDSLVSEFKPKVQEQKTHGLTGFRQ